MYGMNSIGKRRQDTYNMFLKAASPMAQNTNNALSLTFLKQLNCGLTGTPLGGLFTHLLATFPTFVSSISPCLAIHTSSI